MIILYSADIKSNQFHPNKNLTLVMIPFFIEYLYIQTIKIVHERVYQEDNQIVIASTLFFQLQSDHESSYIID